MMIFIHAIVRWYKALYEKGTHAHLKQFYVENNVFANIFK